MKVLTPRTCFVFLFSLIGIFAFVKAGLAADSETVETIVFVRHGEKPPGGLGQLNCQGLNRALALPWVIRKSFGIPAAIYAPDPSEQKPDAGTMYDYVRPLATIEPTAIAFGLPIHSRIGQANINALLKQLKLPAYRNAFVLVAWEHWQIVNLVKALMKEHGGDPALVPDWKGSDFDSIYIVKIKRSGTMAAAGFEQSRQGLNDQPMTCPGGSE